MEERRSLERLAREPLYNTGAVTQTTGVPADTFRAWERRYGLPSPFRTSSNQRLYSEQDIGVINWLRDRTSEGMTISQAIRRLQLESPDVFVNLESTEPPAVESVAVSQTARLHQRLLDAFIAFDTVGAERVIDDALARFSIEVFCTGLVEPALEEIGLRRDRDQLSVAVEHFAARLLERRLAALLTMVAPRSGRGTIAVACPPGEPNEVALYVLAIMLARHGWQIVYLGTRIPTDALVDAARSIHLDLVCLRVSTDAAASLAGAVVQFLEAEFNRRLPVVVVCTAAEAIEQAANLIDRDRSGQWSGVNWDQRG